MMKSSREVAKTELPAGASNTGCGVSAQCRPISCEPGTDRDQSSKSARIAATGASFVGATGTLAVARAAHAAGNELIRIALIGCGGRGTGAAIDALQNAATKNVKLVAMADAFPEPLENSLRAITARCPNQVDVPPERRFVGLDGYQKAIESDVDMVLLCTPPGFRPMQFEAAVRAGKHVFMEKPVAVDAPGVRRVIAANEQAKKKKLLVAVGHHLRHEVKHREVIRRIHDGAIGEVRFLRAYFNSAGVWFRPRKPGQTEMQFQVANWYYFTWLSGDHIVEQHVHDIDVANWIMQTHPIRANGMGGRQARTPEWAEAQGYGPDAVGEIFDHHAVEFEYPNGVRFYSYCRHMPGCWNAFAEFAHGTLGDAEIQGHGHAILRIQGKDPVRWERGPVGHQLEQDHLFAALLAGEPYNECDWAAESSMTAILGRMATYSGKEVTWEQAINSQLDLSPRQYTWDAEPPVKPNEKRIYPCAMPGQTQAW